MKRQILSAALSLLVLVINPTFGCSSPPDEKYNFSEADMRAAVAGKYAGSFNGTSETVTLTLDEAAANSASAAPSLSACGRSFLFVKPAAACVPLTTMAVSGRVSSSYASVTSSAVSGTFSITSFNLDAGTINLTLSDGSTLQSNFSNDAFGTWQYAAATGDNYTLDLVKQ